MKPQEGVYTYRTSGGESISVAGTRHRYPERTYGSVRHRAGCGWEMENQVIEEHTDHRVLCSEPGRVLQLQQSRDGQAMMTRTYLGRGTIDVGGRPVEVEHIRIEGRFTGKATGRSLDDLLLLPDNALTVRWKRMVDTKADAAFGAQVRYEEQADFVLESLEPRR